ncbi:MAG: hypothetical protein IJM30_00030 [Thermoguttaceae bacterium]|nr:hypothetical protein [Thermoguttaceae bacterium]
MRSDQTTLQKPRRSAFFPIALFLFAAFLSACPSALAQSGKPRIWTDITGKHKITATFVAQKGSKVKLEREDGKTITMEIEKLSKMDQAYLKDLESNPFETGVVDDSKPKSKSKSKSKSYGPEDFAPFKTSGKTTKVSGWKGDVYVGDDFSAQLKIPTPIASWSVSPKPVTVKELSKTQSVKFASDQYLPKDQDPKNVSLVSAGDGRFLVSYTLGNFHDAKSYIEVCDVETGKGDLAELGAGETQLTDVSPDGKFALSLFAIVEDKTFAMNASKSFVAITRVAPFPSGFADPDVVFSPGDTDHFGDDPEPPRANDPFNRPGFGNVHRPNFPRPNFPRPNLPAGFSRRQTTLDGNELKDARWLTNDSFYTATSSQLVAWDARRCEPIYRISLDGVAPALSPDRSLIAISSGPWVDIFDAKSGDPIGRVDLKKAATENKGNPPVENSKGICGFSPDGTKLAVALSPVPSVYFIDLKTGKAIGAIHQGGFKRVLWTSNDQVMLNDDCFDVERGVSICHYYGLDKTNLVFDGGKTWTVGEKTLYGAALPQQEALDALNNMKDDDVFAARPGSGLSMKTELNGLLKDAEVLENLRKTIEKSGFKYDPKSEVVVVGACRKTGKTVPDTFTETEEKTKKVTAEVTVNLDVYEMSITVESKGRICYKATEEGTGVDYINAKRDESKTIEQQVKDEYNKPWPGFYLNTLPAFIGKGGGASSLTVATLEPDGLK